MDKELLFKRRLPEADVEIDGVGTVRVRGLSRAEAMAIQNLKGMELEVKVFALGMVDPQLTEQEVREWQQAATPGELEPVSQRIAELSGMVEGADKEAYKSLRSES